MTQSAPPGLVNQLSPALNGKQRQHLRQLGHHLRPVVLVGQHGVSDNLLDNVRQALLSHELIKVKVHDSDDVDAVATAIHAATGAQLAQKIGKNLLFYQQHPETPKITLPK